ncbi:hypothetical protein Y032_0001g223 [Ancylostoma ceylanicum]|nr:hypothetical protein Y032_0001g223 [Ancylostoma ceylanicum]
MMIKGFANRESLRLMKEEPDRANFLMSPAYVNAWYQPERNSITFPYAYLNPPFYNLKYPQAFNYGGQGGTGGHEIVHGFDDEGVQFGPDGSLSKCMWHECGWMTSKSKDGFRDMAQCVVTQYKFVNNHQNFRLKTDSNGRCMDRTYFISALNVVQKRAVTSCVQMARPPKEKTSPILEVIPQGPPKVLDR